MNVDRLPPTKSLAASGVSEKDCPPATAGGTDKGYAAELKDRFLLSIILFFTPLLVNFVSAL
jgi:hypothetical protein